jgi:glycosyltransferase involved in cell wall biosynthesis
MRKIRPDLEFVWIGAGDEELEQLLRSGKVHVTGWLDKVEMAKFLSSAAVYVHTSKFEGFPIAVLDAANFQIPVLVRDIQAFRYAPLAKFSDHLDAVTKIQNLMSDENYYQELVGISQEIANSNSPSAQKSRYQKLIYELTKHE